MSETEESELDPGEPERAPRAQYRLRGRGGALALRLDESATRDLAMLIEGETSGRALDDVLAEFGRSRSAYYLKLKRLRETGLPGLFERPPGPRGPWKRPLEVVRFIVTARLRDSTRTAATIAADLGRRGHEVSARTVQRTLEQFGLSVRKGENAREGES